MTDTTLIWEKVLQIAKDKVEEPELYEWLDKAVLVGMDTRSHHVVLQMENGCEDKLSAAVLPLLTEALYEITRKQYRLSIEKNASKTEFADLSFPILNAYTFDNFHINHSNEFAHAGALAVAISPGDAYNPLNVYGPVGTGKTHLLHAIANEVVDNHQGKIVYLNADHFVNQLEQARRTNKLSDFKHQLQKADLFMMDDLDVLAGNQEAQEVLINIIDYLYMHQKQMVFTFEKHPGHIIGLKKRIVERFGWGLIIHSAAEKMKDDMIESGVGEVKDANQMQSALENLFKHSNNEHTLSVLLEELIEQQKMTNVWLEKIYGKIK